MADSQKGRFHWNVPFSSAMPNVKGLIFEEIVNIIYSCFVGKAVKSTNRSYDLVNCETGAKIEVKCASLYLKRCNSPRFAFHKVKEAEFDKLVIGFHFPDRLEFWIWDGSTGLTTSGKITDISGKQIVICCKQEKEGLELTRSPGTFLCSLPFNV